MGNPQLYRAPFGNKCLGEKPVFISKPAKDAAARDRDDGDRFITKGFCFNVGFGFIVGFYGVCFSSFYQVHEIWI